MTVRQKLAFLVLMLAASALLAWPALVSRGQGRAGGCSDFLLGSDKPAFVLFHLDACPVSKRMRRDIDPVLDRFRGRITVARCDMQSVMFTREELERMQIDGGVPHGVLIGAAGHVFRIYRGHGGHGMLDQIAADIEYLLGERDRPRPLPEEPGEVLSSEAVVDE